MTEDRKPSTENKAIEWSTFQHFRTVAEEVMKRCHLNTEYAILRVQERFWEGIVDAYFDQVPVPGPSEEQTLKELGEKFGVHKTQLPRWREKVTIPRADKFVLLAAAADAKLPRGGIATIRGYCRAYKEVRELMGKPEISLTRTHALCMWAVFRTPEWWLSADRCESDAMLRASREVSNRMREYRPRTTIVHPSAIQSTIKQHLTAWTVLELVLKHEWL